MTSLLCKFFLTVRGRQSWLDAFIAKVCVAAVIVTLGRGYRLSTKEGVGRREKLAVIETSGGRKRKNINQ